MFFNSLNRKRRNKVLVVDVGTEAVKTMLFERNTENNNLFRQKQACSFRQKQTRLLTANTEYFENINYKSLEVFDYALAIHKEFLLGRVLINLPYNILKAKILNSSLIRKEKNRIGRREAISIIKNILNKTREELSYEIALEYGVLPEDVYFVDLDIAEIRIDGYKVPSIKNYEGKFLNFEIVAVFMLRDDYGRVVKILNERCIKNYRLMHVSRCWSAVKLPGIERSALLDIGGQNTDIFIIKDNGIFDIKRMPVGGQIFSDSLSYNLGINKKDARILKEDYAEGKLSIDVQKRISDIFVNSKKEWYKNLENVISEKFLPPNIFIFGGGSSLFKKIDFSISDTERVGHIAGPHIRFITPKDMNLSLECRDKKLGQAVIDNPQYVTGFLMYYYDVYTKAKEF
ncbi:MAG: hypothetical protein UR98_C0008G0002 [Parcubacteria group bacterium GW2011_GWA1_36_12]|nr:MAG: hypothetical protein UR98_C0008G0002 [Parcubacteria group bacterium GW2011_GWA1_36_12]